MPARRDDDHVLAQRVRDGDDEAFAVLVARHRPALVRFAAGRCGAADAAEDAVQEALVSAHRALRDGRVPSDVRAWLHTIAARRTIDLRRRERDVVPLDAAIAASAVPGPDVVAAQSAEITRVVSAWGALPERQRRALTLVALEGRTLREVADDLGVGTGAAKSLIARGRRTLAARLDAAELTCDTARGAMLDAAERGVRLTGDVSRHLRHCTACARAHRMLRLRRRVRAAAIIPIALEQRLRDLLFVASGHEGQIGVAGKVCALACVGVLGAGSAVVATSPSLRGPLAMRQAAAPQPHRHAPAQRRSATAARAPAAQAVRTTTTPAVSSGAAVGTMSQAGSASVPSARAGDTAATGGQRSRLRRSVAIARLRGGVTRAPGTPAWTPYRSSSRTTAPPGATGGAGGASPEGTTTEAAASPPAATDTTATSPPGATPTTATTGGSAVSDAPAGA